ncbi:MAG TPA: hypothetical protein VHN77_10530 [Phycisphaerales bacterium]|nr:hypothetical protein [Phycisphaerales bacterium]
MVRSRSLVLALAAGSTLPAAAHATVLNYASAVSGTASTAARWAPAQVPVAADDLVFNATAGAQAYTVTFDAAAASSRTMEFNQDTVTLSMASPHTTTNGFTIADGATDIAVVTLVSGTWTNTFSSTTGFNIGNVSGAVGTLNVTDDSADLLLTGANSRIRVGNNGTGTLSITGGGRVETGEINLATGIAASNGTLTISGAQAVSPFQRSALVATNASGVCSWGSGNDATATISNGALATLAGDLEVGRSTSSTATLTIGGAGGIGNIHDATLSVAGNAFVGGNDSATLIGGVGAVTVNANGQFNVGGTLHVGNDPNGGTGTLNINSGALVSATNVIDGAGGTINHGAGTLKINGGTYTGHAVPLVVSGTGGPTLQYSGNSVNTLTAAGGVGLRVGDDLGAGTFTGNLIIDSGADVVMSGVSNDVNIGDDTGTTGIVTVTGAGSRLVANQPGDLIRVGFNGNGTLIVDGGGQVLATEIQVPASSLNGNGTLLMNNSANGGPIVTAENLSVGNDAGLGSGSVSINEGTMNVTNPGLGVVIRDTGTLTVTDFNTLSATGTILVDGGNLSVRGMVSAGVLVDVAAGGEITTGAGSDTPTVDGPVHIRSGGGVLVNNSNLTMGDNADPNGVVLDSGSSVTVGSGRTLSLLDANSVLANGIIDMQGGTILCGTQISMGGVAADQLTGFGTIDSNFLGNNLGLCTPTGSGLVFLRQINMNAQFDVSGTAVRIAAGAHLRTFNGPHVFNCKFTADAGSTMSSSLNNGGAFGPITIGDNTTTGATLNGVIHMGTNGSMTLSDLNGVGLGTLTDMNGGIITSVNGLSVGSGRVLRGRGTINANNPGANGFIITPGGTIDPDDYFNDTDTYHGIGHFSIDGRYTQQAGGIYLCEIAGFNNEFQALNDRISCGPAVLNGTLDVSLIDGYVPQQCHEFTILQYSSRTGTWTSIIQPPGANVGVRYEATRAVLFFNSVECDDIDYNNDGLFPDTADIDDFLSVFSGGSCSTGACSDIDFNNDCLFPDTTDIDSLLTVFSGGPCI